MTFRTVRRVALMLGLIVAATGCQEGDVTAPAADPEAQAMASPDVELAFQNEAQAAAVRGDAEQADALRDGLAAVRAGIRPSQIEVKIHNQSFAYSALVVGRVRYLPTGRVLIRSLVAWDRQQPPAVLSVIQKTDQALFGGAPSGNSGVGPARGRWTNPAADQAWVATAGSSQIELTGTGPNCPAATSADLALRCVLSRWDLRINGKFELLPDLTDHVEIHTNASGVVGVILTPSR